MNELNNEQVGVSIEIAIADVFGTPVSATYRSRGAQEIIDSVKSIIKDTFDKNNIPTPITHIAEGQNLVDFILTGNKTLSVKSNKRKLGKVAPQKVGQASSRTWYALLADELGIMEIPETYAEKARLFKEIAISRITELLTVYWKNMFDCDYLIHIYNVVDENDRPTGDPKALVLEKMESPIWDASKISFTKPTVAEWNESNTVKYEYDGVAIGEFQVHNSRDNFKFRFNVDGIAKLIDENRLKFS
ncbi:MAG: hypothetical protein LBM12_02540 [Candidatus Nomurabacteria bacterium]|jgi:hypothetical protein|nr:hypothetical protein [Candidatus Nomurabacteria bacterium]